MATKAGWATWTGGAAPATISAGAYLRTLFTGNSLGLTFNVSNLGTPASEIWTRIDGYGPWLKSTVAALVTAGGADSGVDVPTDTEASPWHLLEVEVKSTSETIDRWTAPSATAVIPTGILLDSGAQVSLPRRRPRNIMFVSDSIGEGVRVINQTAANDTDRNDNKSCWTHEVGRLLGAEVGNVCFGATGLTQGGSGNMPAAPVYWKYIASGVPRPLTPAPDLIAIVHGTNDQSATRAAVTAALTGMLSDMLASTPTTTKIAVVRPLGGYQAAALQAGVAALNSARVHYVDTTGVLNPAFGIDSLGLHPTGPNDLGMIAPALAALLLPILQPAAPRPFRRMF